MSSGKGNSKVSFHLPAGAYSYSKVLCQGNALDFHLEHLCLENTSSFPPLPSSQETFLEAMMERAILLSQARTSSSPSRAPPTGTPSFVLSCCPFPSEGGFEIPGRHPKSLQV